VILYDAHEELSDWVSLNVLGKTGLYDKTSKAIGHVKDRKLIAAVTYNHFRTRPDGTLYTVEMGVYSCDKSWATREFLRAVFEYPFIQLGMVMVKTACFAENQQVIRFNRKLGFKPEGYHREAWPLGGDTISFSMLKNECKWIS
jgi:RimJ/RimL family protein N-acetyltransferase